MLPSPRRSATIVALDELKRREDLESLRKYLTDENCFPALKDPSTAVITMEELKKLARIWKLNERRNFWKEHSDRNDMVAALLSHVEQNLNYATNKIKLDGGDFQAVPPSETKPSGMTGRQAYIGVQLKNYCGKKVRVLRNLWFHVLNGVYCTTVFQPRSNGSGAHPQFPVHGFSLTL
jgi:hypothetical protein